ncbi:MAG: isopentenyl phosphate kinase family protein [Candidatus Bathyarchaeota archaeon]|nr:MAG: isopentenyl phosphate kinase family protein [Candidatus Bathyarchaeota archaeon]
MGIGEAAITQLLKPTLLKLGGSAITIKQRPLTPDKDAITRLAKEIKESDISSLILVHGGGSFGHPLAKQYRLNEGYKDSSQIMGVSRTHQAMTILSRLVVDSLIDNKIPAIVVPPSSCIITKSGRIESFEKNPLIRMLELGFMPVLHGDTVFDWDVGFAILSGDQLVSSLAMKLNAERIIMGADVDGLYTADPKIDLSARRVPYLTPTKLKILRRRVRKSTVMDVTGGMLGKMEELIPAVERGIPVIIVNAAKPNNICRALKGEEVVGTLIERA